MPGLTAGRGRKPVEDRVVNIAVFLKDCVLFVAVCSVAALGVNYLRPGGIPWVQKESYEIFVPCPEPLGEAKAISPAGLEQVSERVLVIDARGRESHQDWHYPEAINVPFNYLYPVEADMLRRIAASGARMVVVYGDGMEPDSGAELARELSGNGIRNVFYLSGGVPGLRKEE